MYTYTCCKRPTQPYTVLLSSRDTSIAFDIKNVHHLSILKISIIYNFISSYSKKKVLKYHQKNFKKYLKQAITEGKPLIRPLWMLDPDAASLQIENEFAVGEDLVVAPSLYRGQTKRTIFLPAGQWKDGIDGSKRIGHKWYSSYHVPIDKVAYFIRIPNNSTS